MSQREKQLLMFPGPPRGPVLSPDEAEANIRASKRQYAAKLSDLRREAGFVSKTVWIPAEDADRFSRYVQRMVKASGRELPTMRSQSGKGDT